MPTLTLSVLLRTVGVPARESGRSMCTLRRGGSELFWVISSMNAKTSASPSVDPGCALPWVGVGAAPASGGARLSRSSRNCRASCCLDLDFVDIVCSVSGVDESWWKRS